MVLADLLECRVSTRLNGIRRAHEGLHGSRLMWIFSTFFGAVHQPVEARAS